MKNYNYITTKYKAINQPKVGKEISVEEVLQTIKNGDENLHLINEAREFGKGSVEYDKIKTYKLPTHRFNFLFKGSASNDNITVPTGLLYLDIDGADSIPQSDYVFAQWKSLSNTGYGVLVKVDNLSTANYKYVYNELSEAIGIESDPYAGKATQQTVLSYDSNLYYNPDSTTYTYIEKEKVSSSTIKERKEGIGACDTFQGGYEPQSIRFNNIGDYFQDDRPYIVFKDKVWICNPFIPRTINEGSRNPILFFLLSQYALLNPNQREAFLLSIGRTIVSKMYPRLSEQELRITVSKVIKGREDKTITMHYNEERRVLFNPKVRLSHKEIMQIVNRELGDVRKELTRAIIYEALEDWDSKIDGKLTQVNVAKKARLSGATIKRY